jgi:hypothetical protein
MLRHVHLQGPPRPPRPLHLRQDPGPIRARHAALREALAQASLDPPVRSIVHIAQADVGSAQVDLDAVVLARDDGRFVLDLVPARRVRDIDEEGLVQIALREMGLRQLVVTAEDLKREPLRANVRQVWAHKDWAVPMPLRMRILRALADEGPIELWRLLEMIASDRDPLMGVLALACADFLEVDLTSGLLGPMTVVRSRT